MLPRLTQILGLLASRVGFTQTKASLLLASLCFGCGTQTAYRAPSLAIEPAWSVPASEPGGQAAERSWWRLLHDPAVDSLVASALESNPTLLQSLARLDEARAVLGIERAPRVPSIAANAAASRATQIDAIRPADPQLALASTASAGLTFSWELDLFGRIRNSVEASRRRLDARDAQAQGLRLDLIAEVASGVLSLRACQYALSVQQEDAASRERVLSATQGGVASGRSAPVELARAQGGLALSRTLEARRKEACERQVNALAALSGRAQRDVRELVSLNVIPGSGAGDVHVPAPPETRLLLPASVLLRHPSVVVTERELAAAWSDIAVARAARLPRLDLAAVLAGQWLRVGGVSFDDTMRSLSAGLTMPLLDGGRGQSTVEVAEARYRAAAARLSSAVQAAWRDVEDALSSIESAKSRAASAEVSASSSLHLLVATEMRWRAGAVNLIELEEARRQFAQAQADEIAASRDRAQAWVALIRASGSVETLSESTLNAHAASHVD